jgi:branched-chain amino acid transport system ATP-binding protein
MTTVESPILELRNVDAGYDAAMVLRDVSVAVPDGGVAVVLGPNGAGKTTLLRAASGLLRTTAGSLLLDDEHVTGASADRLARRGLCHIPEGRGIFPSLTVRENLVIFAGRAQRRDVLDRAVSAFPVIGRKVKEPAGQLSGGEQQMLALSRAYITSPRVVLVDEASMGLAPRVVDQVFEFLSRLAGEGTSLLVVEQYVDRALSIADVVYILDRGQIVFTGSPGDVRRSEIFDRYLAVAEATDAG